MFRNRNKIYFCLGGTLLYLPIIDRSSGCVDRGAVKVDYMTFILKKRLFVLCLFVSFTFVLLSVFLSESLSIHHCFMDFFLIPNICLCRMTGVVVVQAGNVGGHKLSIQGKGLICYCPSQNQHFSESYRIFMTAEPATKKKFRSFR